MQTVYEYSPITLQNIFVTYWGWKLKSRKYGNYFKEYFELLQKYQWLDKNNLIELQNQKLREIIKYSYENVPYYRELFDSIRLKPSDIQTVEDLVKIPILEKDVVRKRWRELLSKVYPKSKAVIYHTSGTTGKPITVYISKNCYEREYAFRWMHYSWGGIKLGGKFATFAGHPVVPIRQNKPPFWRYNLAENQLIFSSQHISKDTLPYYIQALQNFQPDMIHGYPSSIYLIARYMVENKITNIRPKAIFTASETLLNFQREVIEKAFGCKVFNWYGNTEMVAHATECEKGNMHIQLLHSVMEIVDEEGYPVKEGESGIIVGTSLENWAMPLIRYKVGDVAIPKSGKCACGREYPLVENIVGRIEDYIITPEGRYVGRLDHVFKSELHVVEAQIIQEKSDRLRILIVKDEGYTDEDTKKIIMGLQERLGYSIKFEFEFVSKIPRESSGKFRFVVNKLIS